MTLIDIIANAAIMQGQSPAAPQPKRARRSQPKKEVALKGAKPTTPNQVRQQRGNWVTGRLGS